MSVLFHPFGAFGSVVAPLTLTLSLTATPAPQTQQSAPATVSAPAGPTVPHAQQTSGIILLINSSEIDLSVLQLASSPAQTQIQYQTIVFHVLQNTRLGNARKGDTVTITYIEDKNDRIARTVETVASPLSNPFIRQREPGATADIALPQHLLPQDQPHIRTVAVLDFNSLPGQPSQDAYARAFSSLLASKLAADGTYQVTARSQATLMTAEQDAAALSANRDPYDPAEWTRIGKLLGVDAIITGNVLQLSSSEGGAHKSAVAGLIAAPSTNSTKIYANAHLIDVRSGEIVALAVGIGPASQSPSHSNIAGIVGHTVAGSTDPTKLTAESTDSIVAQLASQLEFKLPTPPVSALIAGVDGSTVIINAGTTAGLHVGDKLTIVRKTQTIQDPATGTALQPTEIILGTLIITSIDNGSATGTFQGPVPPKSGDTARTP